MYFLFPPSITIHTNSRRLNQFISVLLFRTSINVPTMYPCLLINPTSFTWSASSVILIILSSHPPAIQSRDTEKSPRRVGVTFRIILPVTYPCPHHRRLRFIIITHSLQSTRDMITKSCGWSRRHRPTTFDNNYTDSVHGFIYVYHNNKSTHNHHRIAHALTIFHSVPIPLNVPVGGGRVATHPLVHRWRFN